MDLLKEPWIDVFTVDGPATVSLLELAHNVGDVLDVVSGDPLEDAAILRMLMAVDLVSEGRAVRWLTSTAGKWNLFDETAPFWQNPQLRAHLSEQSVSPAVTLSYRYAGNGSVLLDHHHNETQLRLAPAAAARALMMRQTFSVGGIQPFPEKIFGLKSARSAIAASRPFVWIDAGNLADTLVANRRPGAIGEFHHTWPGGRPGRNLPPGGQADALTWQSRSMLLIPDADGHVTGISITEGARYGDVTDPQLIPHTTYTRKKPSDPFTAWDVHVDRPGWRQLLTAYATVDAPGVLAAELPIAARIRLAGLASYQSRIDGPVVGDLPVPHANRQDAATLDAGISELRKRLVGRIVAAGRVRVPSSAPDSAGAWWKRVMPATARLTSDFEPIVRRALEGTVTIDDALAEMDTRITRCVDEFAETIAQSSPIAAVAATTPPATPKEGAPNR